MTKPGNIAVVNISSLHLLVFETRIIKELGVNIHKNMAVNDSVNFLDG